MNGGLHHNLAPVFTRWLVARRLLETPFVVADVGVQGGIHPRWDHFGSQLRGYGFDPLAETLEPLKGRPGFVFRPIAIGAEDGERDFYVARESTQSSLTPRHDQVGVRRVVVQRLDSAIKEPIDFLKIDVEGHELDVLRGAGALLEGLIGCDVETGFVDGYIGKVLALLPGFRVVDIAFSRVSSPTFMARAQTLGVARPATLGCPGTVNMLLVRDQTADRQRALKLAAVLELYGLMGPAYEAAVPFVNRAADLLVQPQNALNTARHAAIREAVVDVRVAIERSLVFRLRRLLSKARAQRRA